VSSSDNEGSPLPNMRMGFGNRMLSDDNAANSQPLVKESP